MQTVSVHRAYRLVLAVLASVGLILAAAAGATTAAAGPPSTDARLDGAGEAAPQGAEVVDSTRVAPRQVDLTVESAALGGEQVKVRLLTPDGWNPADRSQHWPICGSTTRPRCPDRDSW